MILIFNLELLPRQDNNLNCHWGISVGSLILIFTLEFLPAPGHK